MGSLSPSTARRESCDSKKSPSAQLFVPQRLDHLKPNGAAGGKNGYADRDCHGRDETASYRRDSVVLANWREEHFIPNIVFHHKNFISLSFFLSVRKMSECFGSEQTNIP